MGIQVLEPLTGVQALTEDDDLLEHLCAHNGEQIQRPQQEHV